MLLHKSARSDKGPVVDNSGITPRPRVLKIFLIGGVAAFPFSDWLEVLALTEIQNVAVRREGDCVVAYELNAYLGVPFWGHA